MTRIKHYCHSSLFLLKNYEIHLLFQASKLFSNELKSISIIKTAKNGNRGCELAHEGSEVMGNLFLGISFSVKRREIINLLSRLFFIKRKTNDFLFNLQDIMKYCV